MNRPWIWNLLLIVLLIGAVLRLPRSLLVPPVPLPKLPEIKREPRTYAGPDLAPPPGAYEEIVSRNLFSPLRGKVEPPPPAAPVPPRQVPPPKATLYGVVIEESGDTYAYLSGAEGQGVKPKKYRQGDVFSNAKVKEIRPDRVILTVGATEHTVVLRTPKEGAAVSRPAVQSVTPRPARPVQREIVRPRTSVRQRRSIPREPARLRRPPVRRRVIPEEREMDDYEDPYEEEEEFYEEEYEEFFDDEEEEYEEEGEEPW